MYFRVLFLYVLIGGVIYLLWKHTRPTLSIFLCAVYLYAWTVPAADLGLYDLGFVWFLIRAVVTAAVAFTLYAYTSESAQQNQMTDTFRGFKLLSRYGTRIFDVTLPVAVSKEYEVEALISSFYEHLETQSRDHLIGPQKVGQPGLSLLEVADQEQMSDTRRFLRLVYQTSRGSFISFFVNLQPFGHFMVTHLFSHFRGRVRWYDIAFHAVLAPFHIWTWFFAWFQRTHSVRAAVASAKYVNAYDRLDVETFFASTKNHLLSEMEQFLKTKGLLTEDVKQIIYNNFQTNHTTNNQGINISGGSGIRVGRIGSMTIGQ